MRIFVDRIAWIALANKEDPNHSVFKEQFKYYLDGGHNFYTTNVIVGNVISHIKETQGGVRANKFYDILEEAWLGTHLHFLWIGRRTQRDSVRLFKKFPEEKLSLFDAANIVLMNRRNIRFIMTTNGAYSKMGFKMIPEN